MGTVAIQGTTFEIYATFDEANDYFKAHANGAAWFAASFDLQLQALVTCSRSFDRQSWVGAATDPVTPQPLAWPRTGVTDRNGQAVLDSIIPQDILNGFWEWVLDTTQDITTTELVPGTNVKATRARDKVDVIESEAETQFFRPTIGQTARFPVAVQEWIQPFLAGAGDATLSFASGTDQETRFSDEATDFGFNGVGLG